jgi:hypothetical protein
MRGRPWRVRVGTAVVAALVAGGVFAAGSPPTAAELPPVTHDLLTTGVDPGAEVSGYEVSMNTAGTSVAGTNPSTSADSYWVADSNPDGEETTSSG